MCVCELSQSKTCLESVCLWVWAQPTKGLLKESVCVWAQPIKGLHTKCVWSWPFKYLLIKCVSVNSANQKLGCKLCPESYCAVCQTAARGHSAHSTDPLQTSCDIIVSLRALSLKNILWHHAMSAKGLVRVKKDLLWQFTVCRTNELTTKAKDMFAECRSCMSEFKIVLMNEILVL